MENTLNNNNNDSDVSNKSKFIGKALPSEAVVHFVNRKNVFPPPPQHNRQHAQTSCSFLCCMCIRCKYTLLVVSLCCMGRRYGRSSIL